MEKRLISGYIMAGIGFVMILINAMSYLLGWDFEISRFHNSGSCSYCHRCEDCRENLMDIR